MRNATRILPDMARGGLMMRRARLGLFAAIGLTIGVGQIALAADLPVKPTYPAPILAPTPVYNWTGFYVGGNLGGA
jgi:outer membrane immunogenic protein